MFHAVNRADHTQGFWNRPRQPGMTEMQYQVNNWYHFVWLSGDHIVEQHVHGIDACNWITRGAPVQATGVGGRRSGPSPASAKFSDHHCVQHTCPDGSYSFSECRQQPGCWSNFSHHAHGTKGFVSFDGGDAVVIQAQGYAAEATQARPGRPPDRAGRPACRSRRQSTLQRARLGR